METPAWASRNAVTPPPPKPVPTTTARSRSSVTADEVEACAQVVRARVLPRVAAPSAVAPSSLRRLRPGMEWGVSGMGGLQQAVGVCESPGA
nr:hypothetical protein OG999_25635 [Streptomyces sp. NBC_00886]